MTEEQTLANNGQFDELESSGNRWIRETDTWTDGPPQFAGNCMGVDVAEDGKMFHVFIEDDEVWHHQFDVNTFWLDELIGKLQAARDHLEANYEKYKWGYRVKGTADE